MSENHFSPGFRRKAHRDADGAAGVVTGRSCHCAAADVLLPAFPLTKILTLPLFFPACSFEIVGTENVPSGVTAGSWALNVRPTFPRHSENVRGHFSAAFHSPLLARPNRRVGHLFICRLFTPLFFRLVFPTFLNGNSQRRS